MNADFEKKNEKVRGFVNDISFELYFTLVSRDATNEFSLQQKHDILNLMA